MKLTRTAILAVIALATGATCRAGEPTPMVFLKTGEKFATQEQAGPTLTMLTSHLGATVAGSTNAFAPHVFNQPSKAVAFIARYKPAVGIVTPGFYMAYGKTLGMTPLLETIRQGVPSERYVLVTRKDSAKTLDDLKGKTITTSLDSEQRYVTGVVLQDKLGRELRTQPATDLENLMFELVEQGKSALVAVLLEEATWKTLFEPDAEFGGKLHVLYRSEELPHDLVVAFRDNVKDLNLDSFAASLKSMSGTDTGKDILRNIRVESFKDINHDRLDRAQKLFTAP